MTQNAMASGVASASLAVGVMVFRGQLMKLEVPYPLLVMDAYSWARSIQSSWEEAAEAAKDDADFEAMGEFTQTTQKLAAWIENGKGVCQVDPMLMVRTGLEPFRVEISDLQPYLDDVLLFAERPERSKKLEFLFVADGSSPVLFVLPRLRALAQHTGPEIMGVTVEPRELFEKIELVRKGSRQDRCVHS